MEVCGLWPRKFFNQRWNCIFSCISAQWQHQRSRGTRPFRGQKVIKPGQVTRSPGRREGLAWPQWSDWITLHLVRRWSLLSLPPFPFSVPSLSVFPFTPFWIHGRLGNALGYPGRVASDFWTFWKWKTRFKASYSYYRSKAIVRVEPGRFMHWGRGSRRFTSKRV